ncbi:GNAT family N-acetyltransferase [Allorhizobium sp. BGMRC 0089]|uniref:GNAT family N-acetyltransferase n=1 Tax=Allorhizobium sonneratiae TaxID=2934936 RepID=UPI00203335B1|nr:GNAT family N-acetyltransferase [Allorhizobium sonneratiae]MCM2292816.1 GNAT family N-acetyltransferase [Allorhizobium sonneratiae]
MLIRPANPSDAAGMVRVIEEIFATGLRKTTGDADWVLEHYINHKDRIECSLAVTDEGRILGFQSLRYAVADNPYGVAEGWGIIGTHVSPQAARQGVGKALFSATLKAAKSFGLKNIDATIGDTNETGLAYYEAMGFRRYRTIDAAICKVYSV